MKSSYNTNIHYGGLLSFITWNKNPSSIVEIGILEGFSLKTFCDFSHRTCNIRAYDIFQEFNGNGANEELLKETFKDESKATIEYGDFYKLKDQLQDNSIDILHIDIANNGDVYEYVFQHYISKIKKDGIIILEGGSTQRDAVEWMNKYNKPKIVPVLEKYNQQFDIITIGEIPSITVVKLKK